MDNNQEKDILGKVRNIEIKSKRLSQNIFAGQYHSAFRGSGMTFSEVREYQFGDDIRNIDWNVTARFHHPYVKVFEEERELTLMLMIDVSSSLDFGTHTMMKRDKVTEIAATLAFSAIQNNDKVGVIFFSDRIEKYIPPKKGRKQILYIIREMLGFKPESNRTDISMALRFMMKIMKRQCTVFLLSDFYDRNSFKDDLLLANHKFEIMAVQVYDQRAYQMPEIGLVRTYDAETEEEAWLDTSDKRVRTLYRDMWLKSNAELTDVFKKCNVRHVSIATSDDYVKKLMALFDKK